MRFAPLALVIAAIVGNAAFAEDSPLPVEVVNPTKLTTAAPENPVVTVGGIVANSMASDAPAPLPVNLPEEQRLLLNMMEKQRHSGNNPSQEPIDGMTEEWADKVKSKYAPNQNLTVRPSGNVMVPVAIGLMNRIETNYKNVSVKTSDESAVLEVDGGVLYVTLNSREPVGLILMEQGVPNSAINLTAVPIDVPPALVKVRVPMTGDMLNEAYQYQRKVKEAELVEKATTEEEEIVRSDRHTERIKEILRYTALGQVPAGFTMADNLSEVPTAYHKPCKLDFLTNKLGQRMIGAREVVDVVLVTNNSGTSSGIKEEMCMSRDTLAVGVMDAATLRPGASTEVYIVRDKNWAKKQNALQTRPRLDKNGSFGLNGYQQVPGGRPVAASPSGVK